MGRRRESGDSGYSLRLGHGILRTWFNFPRVKHLPMVAAASAITRGSQESCEEES